MPDETPTPDEEPTIIPADVEEIGPFDVLEPQPEPIFNADGPATALVGYGPDGRAVIVEQDPPAKEYIEAWAEAYRKQKVKK